MARTRLLKVSFFTNEQLIELNPLTRLLFQALWCEADREGRLEDRPKRIKIKYFPGDNIDVDAALNDLAVSGFIARYIAEDSRNYIQVINFRKHQRPHQNELPSTIPPNQPGVCILGDKHLLPRIEALATQEQSEHNLGSKHFPLEPVTCNLEPVTCNLEPVTCNLDPPKPPQGGNPSFALFWSNFPARNGTKVGEADARQRFEKLSDDDQEACAQAAQNYREHIERTGEWAMDAKKFLRSRSGEPWRDWVEVEPTLTPAEEWVKKPYCPG